MEVLLVGVGLHRTWRMTSPYDLKSDFQPIKAMPMNGSGNTRITFTWDKNFPDIGQEPVTFGIYVEGEANFDIRIEPRRHN